jgi:hypothetical protein
VCVFVCMCVCVCVCVYQELVGYNPVVTLALNKAVDSTKTSSVK